jgi:hypothetical protein
MVSVRTATAAQVAAPVGRGTVSHLADAACLPAEMSVPAPTAAAAYWPLANGAVEGGGGRRRWIGPGRRCRGRRRRERRGVRGLRWRHGGSVAESGRPLRTGAVRAQPPSRSDRTAASGATATRAQRRPRRARATQTAQRQRRRGPGAAGRRGRRLLIGRLHRGQRSARVAQTALQRQRSFRGSSESYSVR